MKFRSVEEFTNDEFIGDSDRKVFEEYLKDPSHLLFEMANFLGNRISKEDNLPFSFYISSKDAVHGVYGIRVKIIWNPSRMVGSADGSLALHGDYEYEVGSHKYKPTSKELNQARNFFKKYKVLMAAIWEGQINADDVYDYLKGNISFRNLINTFFFIEDLNIESKELYELYHCKDIKDLEQWVRKYNIFNLND